MSTTTTEVAKAQAALEAAQNKAREAQERAEQAAARHAQERATRLVEAARVTLDQYDETALDEDVTRARTALSAAVLADPVWSAAVDLWAAQTRKYHRAIEATVAANRLNAQTPAAAHPPAGLRIETVLEIVGREAEARAGDEQDERDANLQHYAETGQRRG